jgi:hypothetical protein
MNLISKEQTHTLVSAIRLWIGSRFFLSAVLHAIIPILFLVSVDELTKAKGPQWLPDTFENPYNYLFNSLLLVQGKPSPYVMHPGTTTLTLGALVLRATTLKNTDQLVEDALKAPEKPIKQVHFVLLISTALMIWVAPWLTALALRNIIPGLLIQAPVLFYQSLLYWSILFGPELMNVGFSVAVVCCCVLLLIPSTVSEKTIVCGLVETSEVPSSLRLVRIPFFTFVTVLVWALGIITWRILFGVQTMNVGICLVTIIWCLLTFLPVSQRTLVFGLSRPSKQPGSARFLQLPLVPFMTGLLCALGIATKLVFFPLILISLFCCRTVRNLATFTAALVLGTAVALAPIYSQLPNLFTWTLNLGVHQGVYGTGSVGLPGMDVYLQSVETLFACERLVVIIPTVITFVVILLAVLGNRQPPEKTSWRTVLSLFGIQLFSFLLLAKQPYPRYLSPLGISVGLNLALLSYAFPNTRSFIERTIVYLALTGSLLFGVGDFILLTPATYRDLHDQKIEEVRLYKHAKEITKNGVRIDYYFSDSPEYPLWSANKTTGYAYSSLLARLYPNAPLFYDAYTKDLETFAGPLDISSELRKHDVLYFLGYSQMFPKLKGIDPYMEETIDTAGDYGLERWTRK